MLKKIISILFIFFLFISKINAYNFNLTSDKYILYNLTDNKLLLEKDSHKETQIASLTKIMTVTVALENIKDYDKKIVITKEMLDGLTWDIATIGFKVGDIVSYDDLLYSAMLPSAADAVNALAISISGSYDKYLKLMNKKALELMMLNTHYSNVIGLSDELNYSSAYDISILLRYALKNEKFKEIFTTKTYTLSNGKKINSTIYKFDNDYILGSKTGYTTKAGRCIASISNVKDTNFMLVTLNNYSKNKPTYITETNDIYKYFDENYSYKNIIDEDDLIISIKANHSKEKEYNVKVTKEYTSFLPNTFNKKDLVYKYDGIKEISYYNKKNEKIGNVKVFYKDELLKEIDLFYDGSLTLSISGFLVKNLLKIIIISIILIIIIYAKKNKKYKKRYRK